MYFKLPIFFFSPSCCLIWGCGGIELASGLPLNAASFIIPAGWKKPGQQRSFISCLFGSWERVPCHSPLGVCVCVCVCARARVCVCVHACVCFPWGNSSGRWEEGCGEPVLQHSWAPLLPFTALGKPWPPDHTTGMSPRSQGVSVYFLNEGNSSF